MTKYRKAVCVVLTLATILLIVAGCSPSVDPIVGEWVGISHGCAETITLLASGRANIDGYETHGNGTWEKVSNSKYVMLITDVYGSAHKIDIDLNGSSIVISDNGNISEFTRK